MTKRWLDDGAPQAVRDLLDGARTPRQMRPDERARSRTRLRATMAPLAAGLGLWAKGGLFAAALAMAGTSAWVVARGGGSAEESARLTIPPASPRSTVTHVEAVAPPAATSTTTLAPTIAASASSKVTARPPSPRSLLSPSPSPSAHEPTPEPVVAPLKKQAPSLAAEAALLEQARQHLTSDPNGALQLAEEHRQTFPGGQLGPERDLIAIDALMRLGRHDAANRRAAPLLAQPGLYRERALGILGAR